MCNRTVKLKLFENFKTKNISLPKNVERGPFGLFRNPVCCKTSQQTGTNPSQRPLKFPKYAKVTVFKLSLLSKCRKILQGIRIRLGKHFSSTETINRIFGKRFFGKVLKCRNELSAQKLIFPKLKSAMKAGGYPLTKRKFWNNAQSQKKL